MSTALTRDAILGATDLKVAPLDVPEWGGTVYLRTITGLERERFEESISPTTDEDGKIVKKNLDFFRARFAAMVCADADGNRLFTDKDIDALGRKSARPLERILKAGMGLNGMGKDDLEELEKNSGTVPSADSTSGSPSV